MCTVQGCTRVAVFMVTGDTDRTGRRVVAAYCDPHAEEMATRLGPPAANSGTPPGSIDCAAACFPRWLASHLTEV